MGKHFYPVQVGRTLLHGGDALIGDPGDGRVETAEAMNRWR